MPCRLIRFSVTNYRYQSEATYRSYVNIFSIAAIKHTWVLFTIAHGALTGQYSIVCYRPVPANGLFWPDDQHRVSEGGLYFVMLFSIENLLKMLNIIQTIKFMFKGQIQGWR